MLWLDEHGWLSSVEAVDVADEHGKFNPIPPRSMYEAPQVGGGPASRTKGLRSVVARLLGRKAEAL
jgi:hypothetical protein